MIETLQAHHVEHLAKLERLRGVKPRTLEKLKTVRQMADAEGLRVGGDTLPAVLVGVIGGTDFTRNEHDAFDGKLQLGLQVTVFGTKRRDVLLRRDWTAWTVIECLIQRLPRGDVVKTARLLDYEPEAEGDTQRTLGDARIVMEVEVVDMVALTGGLGSPWPPGSPGGPPPDPYTPPEDLPVATEVTFSFTKESIVE